MDWTFLDWTEMLQIQAVWPCGEMNWHCEWVRRVSFRSDVLLLYFLSPTDSVQFFQTSIRCEGKIKNCRDAIFWEKCSFLLSGALECVKYVIFTLLEKSGAIWHSKEEKPFCLVPQILLYDFKLTSWRKEGGKRCKVSLNQNPLCTSMKGVVKKWKVEVESVSNCTLPARSLLFKQRGELKRPAVNRDH